MKKSLHLIIYALIFLNSAPVFAEKMRIAVIDFKGKGVDAGLAINVSELIRTEMINTGQYIVVERAQMDQILKEQGFQQTGCTDVSCAVQVGKLLSARKIMIGTVMRMGRKIIINARIVDVEKGVGEFGEKESALSEDDIDAAVTRFTQKLTARIAGGIPYKNNQFYGSRQTDASSFYKYTYTSPWTAGLVSIIPFYSGSINAYSTENLAPFYYGLTMLMVKTGFFTAAATYYYFYKQSDPSNYTTEEFKAREAEDKAEYKDKYKKYSYYLGAITAADMIISFIFASYYNNKFLSKKKAESGEIEFNVSPRILSHKMDYENSGQGGFDFSITYSF